MQNHLLVERRDGQASSLVSLGGGRDCGGGEIVVVAGPCSVEDFEQMDEIGKSLSKCGVAALRGGAFKPRTSPYEFQGLGNQGLQILEKVGRKYQMPVITEVMSCRQAAEAEEYCDVFQVGSRNMQNFELLKTLGSMRKPVLLKRGLSATIEEFLLAAEYVVSRGNQSVILCERGIRSFDPSTRNVLDLGSVVLLKQLTHLPVLVDPSHASGKRELVAGLSRAAIAAGADGLIIECHPRPDQSLTDARQALSLSQMAALVASLVPVARAVGRDLIVEDLAVYTDQDLTVLAS